MPKILAALVALALLSADGRALAAAAKKKSGGKGARVSAPRAVAGIRPGMTLEEVRAVLAAHRPPFPPADERAGELRRLPELKFVPDVTSNISGTSLSSTAETVTAYLTPPPIPSRVFGVERDVRFAPDERPTEAGLKETLERAYGKAPFSTPAAKPKRGEARWAWSWLPDGAIARRDPSACRAAFDAMTSAGIWWKEIGATPPTIPGDCGSFIEAKYDFTDDGKGRVVRLRLALFDLQALRGAAFAAHDEARKRTPPP